ncbi:coiled-coil domain-containing protein 160 [Protopterus annectens]|uniref:coiled-coil domain-containing protein 160 n=1 Tax=Protopterus annectens TaxID=7888 RepID=UPI001CF9D009|nr:coiled-coil domain-containing protein 160 [Protopterus annectens]XP_043935948.1 coiled-coil domain-containing protein 160 [Protopterus annectens]XP_043935949.1 coiled-coil domain-containing protein 160 [Protopterus annectens]
MENPTDIKGIKEHHWVEKLFPPRFTVEDLFSDLHQKETVLVSEKVAQQRARRIAGIYLDAVNKLQEEKKQRKECYASQKSVQQSPPKVLDGGSRIENSIKMENSTPHCANAGESLEQSMEESIQEIEESCIWNAQELAALRSVMCKKDPGGGHLKLQLATCETEMLELRIKWKKAVHDLEAQEREILNFRKALNCANLHLKQVQTENAKKDQEIKSLLEGLSETEAHVRSLKKDLHQSRLEIQELNIEKKRLLEQIQMLKRQQEKESRKASEKVKIKFESQLRKLQREMETVKIELSKEKEQHSRDINALEVLKKHFVNLAAPKPDEPLRFQFL